MSELIVKDNALIQASYTLDTVEQRLILLASRGKTNRSWDNRK